MPRPSLRTRSKKRVHMTLPGGRHTTHYKQANTSLPHCSICGNILSGIPRMSTVKARKLNRSRKRIQRPYGGQVCPNCLKNALKQAARTLRP